MKKIFITSAFLINSLAVFAQENPYATQEFQEVLKHDTYEPNYFTLIFGLVFVICLIYLTGFFYQKLIGINSKINKKTVSFEENKFKILSSMPLGQGRNLYAAEINGKVLALGASANQITLLREFSKEEVEEFIKNNKDKADE